MYAFTIYRNTLYSEDIAVLSGRQRTPTDSQSIILDFHILHFLHLLHLVFHLWNSISKSFPSILKITQKNRVGLKDFWRCRSVGSVGRRGVLTD